VIQYELVHQFNILIPGKPIPQIRHRHRVIQAKGKKAFATTYDPLSKEKESTRLWLRANVKAEDIDRVYLLPITLSIVFVMPRPLAHYGTGKNSNLIKAFAPKFHIAKPDTDNLLKYYKDCMSKLVYHDDSQVFFDMTMKVYGNYPMPPHTKITVTGVK